MELTKAQKNELWRAIQTGGLDPRTCALGVSAGYDVKIASGAYRFDIRTIGPYYIAKWNTGAPSPVDPFQRISTSGRRQEQLERKPGYLGWPEVLAAVQVWAHEVRRLNQAKDDAARAAKAAAEAQARVPDLWELGYDPEAASQVAAVDDSDDNRPFTAAEQAEIASQIRAIKESLKQNSELTAEQLNRVEARLDQAEEASHRLGRKDWVMLFGGGVLALILADAIPPDVANHIFTGVLHGLVHLFTSGLVPGILNP